MRPVRLLWRAVIVVLIAGIAFAVDRQLAGKIHPDSTTLALVVVALVLLIVLAFPAELRELMGRVTHVQVGSFALGFHEVERSVAVDRFPGAEEYGARPIPVMKRSGTTEGDLDQISDRLQQRLRWLANELELKSSTPEIENLDALEIVNALLDKRLLDDDQAQFATDLLAPNQDDVLGLPSIVRENYVRRGWRFANRIRATVFDRAVRRDLDTPNSFIADFKQETDRHRPDFLAALNHKWFLIAPRVALDADSDTDHENGQIALTSERWMRENGPSISLSGRVIVIPRTSDASEREGDGTGLPRVVKRSNLADRLALLAESA